MKLLVTGASGFVGGALWRAAVGRGWEVRATGRRPLSAEGYASLDLARPWKLDFAPDVVVHAAARSAPWGSRSDFEAQNVTVTQRVVNFCEQHGRPLLVHISTSAVMYRNEHQLGLDEKSPLPERPINVYAATKLAAERVVQRYGGPWCIVRPRAVFGPGDTVVFPRILRAARSGRLPLIESRDTVMADLIYIDSLVEYLLRIVEQRRTGLYLVTNNRAVPVLEFVTDVLARLGLPTPTHRVPVERAMLLAGVVEKIYACLPFFGEPPVTRFGVSVFAYSKTFDVSKALRDLGPPAVSLQDGVERFVAWQKGQTT